VDKTVIIALGYKARHGKDEAVKSIVAARSGKYDVRRYAFADVLKEEVNAAAQAAGGMLELFKQGGVTEGEGLDKNFEPFPSWVIYDTDADMTDPLCPLGKQRTLLQWWGTEYRRDQDSYYWVKLLQKKLEEEKPTVALISDLRFPNEVSWVNANKGYVVRVDRIGYKPSVLGHQSEEQLNWMADEDWHYILQVADGDIEELKRDAVVIFDHVIENLTPPDLSEIERFVAIPGDLQRTN
jgi:hypothetical protein